MVWGLMGALVVGLGGFGVTNFGGQIDKVGRVGETPIPVDAYARALRGEVDALSAQLGQTITFQQAKDFGADSRALSQVIIQTTLDNEAAQMGLSVGDQNVVDQIVEIQAFKGSNGQFDREAYRFALDRAGLSEAEFETSIRVETARAMVQRAAADGLRPADGFLDTLLTYIAQKRDIAYVILHPEDLQIEVPEATDAQLQEFYEANIGDFTLPERKKITYVLLTPNMLSDTVEVDEATLRAAYDERSEQYISPERRLVERLVFPSDEAANEAKDRLDAGEVTFEELVEARSLELMDLDLGDVSASDLGDAGDAVFAAEVPSVTGPVPTNLGPALFRVNGALPEQITTFEEALPDLRSEFAIDRARRVIEQQSEDINDLLASGATLEELDAETDMTLGQIEYFDGVSTDIAAYPEFRSAAAPLSEDDFPDIATLSDGGIFAMRLDEILAPRPQPLDDVRDEVAAAWHAAETNRLLTERAEALKEALAAADTTVLEGDLQVATMTDMSRSDFVPETPDNFAEAVFNMEAGQTQVISDDTATVLVRLDDVRAPDLGSDEMKQMRELMQPQADAQFAQDVFSAYVNALRKDAGLELDQAAINAVNAQYQ
ncbi:peptidyl-prolyl cis-trans isomerase D [Donghicola tyrosinivorans]|uniref:Peptidyl-prolyl cis-trans isomerase D n=2 Tax=Donghicola tyrosinivorans TaxID=1652492 RepID=A0A2T0X5G6_9RHOB|nr:peptidyl-prolyl cis-trans isomerase D [Donghicola tyrosinivorans]